MMSFIYKKDGVGVSVKDILVKVNGGRKRRVIRYFLEEKYVCLIKVFIYWVNSFLVWSLRKF